MSARAFSTSGRWASPVISATAPASQKSSATSAAVSREFSGTWVNPAFMAAAKASIG